MYDKYKKVKSSTDPDKSIQNVSKYINDDEKTVFSTKAALDYIENEAKTYEVERHIRLVSGYNCDADTAVEEFAIARNSYYSVRDERLNAGQTPVQAYHLISSFKGKVDPELAHRIGKEFCQRLLGDSFQAVISTHINTDNTHNHILVNAYALDGAYKFKDEYHLYKKLRSISNDLSLKYGIPLYMGDEQTKSSYRHTSWSELLDKDKFKAQKEQFKHDIEEAATFTSDYKSFLEYMTEKGYTCVENKNSTTFKSQEMGLSFRDNTLGTAYTRAALQKKWDTAQKNLERQEIMTKVNAIRKENALKYKKYDTVLVPKWDEFGNRLGLLKRLLLVIKNLLEQIGDDYYSAELEEMNPQNRNFQPAFKKLANINRTIELLDQYRIKTDAGLQEQIRLTGMGLSVAKNELLMAQNYLTAAENIIDKIDTLNEISQLLSEAQIPYQSIQFLQPTTDEIRENLASLQPISSKTQNRLYRKMHNCIYRLALPLNQISNSEAREILEYLDSLDTDKHLPRPALLITKEEFFARKYLKSALPEFRLPEAPLPANKPNYVWAERASAEQFKILCNLKRAYPDVFVNINPSTISNNEASKIIKSVTHAPKRSKQEFDFSVLSPEPQALVKEYRLIKSDLLEYGLDTEEATRSFMDSYLNLQDDLQKYKDNFENITQKYKDLRFIQRIIIDSQKPAFVYGSAYAGQPDALNLSKANLGSSKLDHLFEVHDMLVRVAKNIDISTLSNIPISSDGYIPPSPEIKSVLNEVQNYLPYPVNVDTITEYEALYLLKQLIEQQEIESEIERLTELEREQDNQESKTKDQELFEKFMERKL